MRNSALLTTLVLVSCVRSPAPQPTPPRYEESIRFPNVFESGGVRLGRSAEKLLIDGPIVQAMMVAAQDFIPPYAGNDPCWNRPGDFLYEVIRQENIIFVQISPDYFSEECALRPAPLDWSAKYAISIDGRILRRVDGDEPDGASLPSSPDAGDNEDAGHSQLYELSDLDRMDTEPVDDPPFFTRPEWQAKNPWPPSRKPRTPSFPDGGTPDGGTPDGGTPDGGFHADGGPAAIPPGFRKLAK